MGGKLPFEAMQPIEELKPYDTLDQILLLSVLTSVTLVAFVLRYVLLERPEVGV